MKTPPAGKTLNFPCSSARSGKMNLRIGIGRYIQDIQEFLEVERWRRSAHPQEKSVLSKYIGDTPLKEAKKLDQYYWYSPELKATVKTHNRPILKPNRAPLSSTNW
jgi:hypothetical protein